jgi:para-nitrobenzyl esterase
MAKISVRVRVREGTVSGVTRDDVTAFLGIPYAASPAGERRFRPPAPHPGWDGTRDGSRPGPSAPQGTSRLAAIMGGREPDWDEDGCLNLNVWVPAAALADGARPRPVFLWFHGGAWATGSGGWDWYAGDRLAAAGDIVVVTANYRLGPLGYLWRPEAEMDNLGGQDQAAALAWVHETIAAFGGDPRAITVGGQSAGAYSAIALALDPATSGYVHRLVLQSGPWGMAARQPADAAAITAEYLRLLGTKPDEQAVTALRSVPVRDLLGAAGQLARALARPGDVSPPLYPVVTGAGLPRDWRAAMGAGGLAGKAVLIGSTADEMAAFLPANAAQDGTARDGAARDRAARDRAARDRADQATAEVFGDGVTEIAADCARRGTPAYAYRFTRVPGSDPAVGAPHCADLPFAFGTLDAFAGARMLGDVSARDVALAREFTAAIAAFAATGVPGAGWPPYQPAPDGFIRRVG